MNKKERLVFRKMRKGLRIPQAVLAKETGLYRTKIVAWENGEIELTPEEESRLGDAIDAILAKRGVPGTVSPEQAQEDSREGAVLARVRAQYGITQTELAQAAKDDRSTISGFEKGHVSLAPDRVARLFQAIDSLAEKKRALSSSRVGTLADLLPPKNPQEYEKWRERMILRSNPDLPNPQVKEQNRVLQKLVAVQKELISELMKESKKDAAKILQLEKQVKDLRELYDVGTQAVVATERYEELREKVLAAKPAATNKG